MLKTLFSSVTGALGGIYGYLAVAALCIAIGAGGTWRVMSWREGAQVAEKAKGEVRLVVHQSDITMKIGDIIVSGVEVARTNTIRITQEIPKYVTSQIDHDFPVPLGFVRVWNDASHGPVPDASVGADADPSGVPLSDVAQAHASDEGTLDVCRVRLKGWQDWYVAQRDTYNKATGN